MPTKIYNKRCHVKNEYTTSYNAKR